jgi:hypothetical protein
MGGSGAATCPEKVIYPKASTVSPGPHGRVPDPWIYSPDLQGWFMTSTCASRTPRMGSGPSPRMGSQGLRTEHTRALNRTQTGVQCRHVPGPSLVGSGPVRIYSYSPLRRRPDATTWHTAHGLSQRAEPSMTLRATHATAFSTDNTSACPFH